MQGPELIQAATRLVVDALRRHPEGLTNAEVDGETGLNLPVPSQSGYITWTILQHLMTQGTVAKEGKVYRLIQASRG